MEKEIKAIEEKIRAINLEKLRQAVYPLEVTEEPLGICVEPAAKSSFIAKSTIDKIAGAVALFGFSGYMIKVDNDSLRFIIY